MSEPTGSDNVPVQQPNPSRRRTRSPLSSAAADAQFRVPRNYSVPGAYGAQSCLDISDLAHIVGTLANTMQQQQMTLSTLVTSNLPTHAAKFNVHQNTVAEAFSKLPSLLKSKLEKELRYFGDLAKKSHQAVRDKHLREQYPNHLHRKAREALEATIQLSKEDLLFTQPFDSAARFEEMRKRHSKEIQEFMDKKVQQQIVVYGKMISREEFRVRIFAAVDTFFQSSDGVYNESEKEKIVAVTNEWYHNVYINMLQKKKSEAKQKVEKDAQLKEKRAHGKAAIEAMSQEE